MRDWSYGINSHADWRLGSIELVDQPWWLDRLNWFAWWIDWRWLHKLNLPDWPKRRWDKDDEERWTPREYYGTVGDLVFAYVTQNLYAWAYRHPRRKAIHVELGYDRVREIFYEQDKKFFDEMEELDEPDETEEIEDP